MTETAPIAETTPAPAPETATPDAAKLQAEVSRSRFDAVAARSGLDDAYSDVLHAKASAWLAEKGLDATRENFGRFIEKEKTRAPKLFASLPGAPSNTAPTVAGASASAPAPGAIETPYSRWQSLKSAGRSEEAKAYYLVNARQINRGLA